MLPWSELATMKTVLKTSFHFCVYVSGLNMGTLAEAKALMLRALQFWYGDEGKWNTLGKCDVACSDHSNILSPSEQLVWTAACPRG